MREDLDRCPGCFLEPRTGTSCARCGYSDDPGQFPSALPPGTQLSKYVLGRVLGRPGGFGITYLGFDTVLNRRVAIKELMPRELVARMPDCATLHVHTREDEELFRHTLASFLDEARLIAQFNHPNLVRVLDFFKGNATAYFAMEYYQGQTLAEYTDHSGGTLPGHQAVALMLPLLDALENIHSFSRPILHRDIKPANIYVTDKGTPILLDFGAARVALGQQSRSLFTVLTPGFAPYEQYSTRGNQGPWSDVYGCAATLYFLVTGRVPPEASERVNDPRIEPPVTFATDLPIALSNAIVRGLGFKPEDRPSSAREFAALITGRDTSLRTAAEVPPVIPEGSQTGAVTRTGTPSLDALRDDRTGIGPTPMIGGRTEPGVPTAGAGRAAASPAVTPKSRQRLIQTIGAVAAVALLAVAGYALTTGDEPAPQVIGQTIPPPQPAVLPPDAAAPPRSFVDSDPTTSSSSAPPVEGLETEKPAPARARNVDSAPVIAQSPPASQPPAPAPPPTGVLVVVFGDDPAGVRQVESVVLSSLTGRSGLTALDPNGLSMLRADQAALQAAARGDFGALANLGRTHGAELLVVGDLTSGAVPSVNRFFTGTAELDLRMYRVSTGTLVNADTYRVGQGATQAVLAISDGEARSRAAKQAGDAAAADMGRWLQRAFQ